MVDKLTFHELAWAPGPTRALMAALLWGLGLVFLFLGGISFYIWCGVFALVGFSCAIFNVSTKCAEGGVLCVYVCGIRIFKVDAAQVRSIRLVNNAATSWTTRWLFGLYIAGRRKWWAAAGVPWWRLTPVKRLCL